ncbi:MAG: PKD domain-containing protein [Verrucomicrobia bacterium]|nr:PKD domain-containing protein [Verrucomicrobiota bacterium]
MNWTKQATICLGLCLVLSSSYAGYAPVYTADLSSTAVTNDFTYSQVGTMGNVSGTHAPVIWTNNSLRMLGRYGQKPGLRIKPAYVTNSLKVQCSFRLYNTSAAETLFAMGWRMRTNATANTYPLYYLLLGRNETNSSMSTIQIVKKWNYSSSDQVVLARYDYTPTPTINTSVFDWNLTSEVTATNQFGDQLTIGLSVTNNGSLFCTLGLTDTAVQVSGELSTPIKDPTGGMGIVAGAIDNNGTFVGVEILSLIVSEDPVSPTVTPEMTIAGVGNSFTYYNGSYPFILYDIAAVAGHPIETGMRALAGRTLKMHCTETNTLDWLAANEFDFYGINELSLNSTTEEGVFYSDWRTNEFPYYLNLMIQTIQVNHAGATIGLYEPWPAKTNILATGGMNSQVDLTALYTNVAAQYANVVVMPFGRAMYRVHRQAANPNPPVLSGDASEHPAAAGTYLISCVVYSMLYDESTEGLPYYKNSGSPTVISFTNENYATFLQRIAYDTYRRTVFTNPPQVSVSIPDIVATSSVAYFSASATDDGTITNYLWAFGDGTFTNGPGLTVVGHAYSELGGRDVNVTVQDDAGEWERWGRWINVATGAEVSVTNQFYQWLEQKQGQSPSDPDFAIDVDSDGDGMTTWQEFIADTNPGASGSVFAVDIYYDEGADELYLSFPASTNRFYQVDYYTNLLLTGSLSDIGWGETGMVVTNTLPGDDAAFWGFRASLTEPAP